MTKRSRVVTSTACPVSVTRPVVTVTCPPARTLPATTLVPTTAFAGTTADLTGAFGANAPQQVFNNPITQLAPLSPLASLAATNPSAALAALSPTLTLFNPAINPAAALLQFNPVAAPSLAIGGFGKPFFPFFGI